MIDQFLAETMRIAGKVSRTEIHALTSELKDLRQRGGRLFVLGVGGSAANASHAVNDFRKLCGIEAYAPTDNVAELTARTNDEGWENTFADWLKVSNLDTLDAVLVLSVGGGNLEKNISPNIVRALQYAKAQAATILGIVGKDGGYTAQVADACVIIPPVNPEYITPHTEAWQAVIWHLVVWEIKTSQGKWESQAK